MNETVETGLSKVPAVTPGFWVIKVAATTPGETRGRRIGADDRRPAQEPPWT